MTPKRWLLASLVASVAILAGVAAMAYTRYQETVDGIASEAAERYRGNPIVQDRIGADATLSLESCEFTDTEALLVLHAHGSKGMGEVHVRVLPSESGPDSATPTYEFLEPTLHIGDEQPILLPE
jgi:hypothetical protein